MSDKANLSITYLNVFFTGLSALGGISGLLSVIILVIHRSKDKKAARIQSFLNRFQNRYQRGGRFLEHLLASGINLLKNDSEIMDALESLQSIYHTHPLRQWYTDVQRIGYQKFFKYAVSRTHQLNSGDMDNLINVLEQ